MTPAPQDLVDKIVDVYHNLGKLEGRVDSIEDSLTAFEERVEIRLNEISSAIKTLLDVYNKGKGIRIAIGVVVGLIVLVPSLMQLSEITHNFLNSLHTAP